MDTTPLFEFSDRAELRQWLEENHGTTPHCWVATTRGKEPRCGAIPYPEVVAERDLEEKATEFAPQNLHRT